MVFKRWVIVFLILTVLLLAGFGTMTYIADPLLQFRPESDYITSYKYMDIYSNPGIARQYSYDTVLVGTSMMENTSVSLCNDLFDCESVRLTYSGGTAYNMKRILDICFQRDQKPQRVIWALDEFQLRSAWDTPRYPLPEYLYNRTPEGILSYLLNLDIYYNFTRVNYMHTRQGMVQKAAREEEMLFGTFGKEHALHAYDRPVQVKATAELTSLSEAARMNMEKNILPLIRENPDTEFTFLFVPYSILYWDNELRLGTFDSLMYMLEETVGTLLAYDNVSIYFYHDWWEMVLDLDNYKDYSHYGKWINDAMLERVAKDECRLTEDNYRQVIADMTAFIHSYDFESIYTE